MLPSWLLKLKDIKRSSYKKLPSSKRRHESPVVLARTISLRRANDRAKFARSEALVKPCFNSRCFSKSIDALYLLFSMKDGAQAPDTLTSDESEGCSCRASCTGGKVTRPPSIHDRSDEARNLCDPAISSTAIHSSNYHTGSPRSQGTNLKSRQGPKPFGVNDSAASVKGKEASILAEVSTIESPFHSSNFINSTLGCRCGYEAESRSLERMVDHKEASLWKKQVALKKARARDSQSLSAFLPPDLKGAVGDSIAVVKFSHDPYKDFRDSMYEMIMEEELKEARDMEELVYCYLSLNSPEHHELIKDVFRDVWSEILSRSS